MKKTLLLAFVAIASLANSQNLTMTKAAFEPTVGDIKSTVSLDTTFYTTGLPSNITGTNVTWDFSNLAINSTVGIVSSTFIAAATATATPPAGATLAEDQGGSYTFYKSVSTPTTQYELMSVKFGTTSLTFTNTGIVAQWPIAYGYNLIDNVGGTANFSITAQFTGSVNSTADGMGTLKMPLGNNFTNVLRIKSVQTLTFTVFTIPIANIKQVVYQYYRAGDKFPLLTINSTATTFSSQTTNATTASGNAAYLPIGIKENSIKHINFNVLPNPASTQVSVELENNNIANSLILINSIGQTIKTINNNNTINVSDIPTGVYYLEVHAGDRSARKPVMITH